MHNVARLAATAGTIFVGLAITGCTLAIDPVETDAASPATTTPPPSAAVAAPADCQDEFTAALLWDPELEVPVTGIVQLTNEGAGPCDLTGFPGGVDFLADGQPLTISYDVEQVDGFDRAGTTVTVDPGASAYVWIWVDRAEPVVGAPPCEFPVTATELALTLPGSNVSVAAPVEIEVCTDERMLLYGPVDSEPRVAALGF